MDSLIIYVTNNKWCILFLVFGILISYTLGQRYAINSQAMINKINIEPKINEDFIVDKIPKSAVNCNSKKCLDNRCVKPIKKPTPKKCITPKKIPKINTEPPNKKNTFMSLDDVEKLYISKLHLGKLNNIPNFFHNLLLYLLEPLKN